MQTVKVILAGLFMILGLVGAVKILISAWQDAWWKAVLGLVCGFYLLWYAVFDFEDENKWLWVILAFGGGTIATGILQLGG